MDHFALGDSLNFNLLHFAAKIGDSNALTYLINEDFDVNLSVDGKNAVNLAWINNHQGIVLQLLKANSTFPQNFQLSKVHLTALKNFALITEKLHAFIRDEEISKIDNIIKQNKSLRYFYDFNNQSAIKTSLRLKQFKAYELLSENDIHFGPFEDSNVVLDRLNEDEKIHLRNLHVRFSKGLSKKHIITLMSNSYVGHDTLDEHRKFKLVKKAYKFLNNIYIISLILQTVAASKNFKIIFDFKRKNVRYIDPTANRGTNGMSYLSGRIIIAAEQLLNPLTERIVFGVIAHEMTHYAMFLVFRNYAIPYFKNDLIAEEQFSKILEECKAQSYRENIINLVFTEYEEDVQRQELVVRIPEILASFDNDFSKIKDTQLYFPSLWNDFNNRIVLSIQNELPKITMKAEMEIQKMANKKYKRLYAFLTMFSFFFLTIIFMILFFFFLTNQECDRIQSFSKLSNKEKIIILNRQIYFQGINQTFENIFSKSPNVDLNYCNLLNLNNEFIIGKEIDADLNKFLERTFSNSAFQNKTNSLNFKSITDVAQKNKTVIISGAPGSGKSLMMRVFAHRIKKNHKDYWVSYVNLQNFSSNEFFGCIDGVNINYHFIINHFKDIFEDDFEQKLFKYFYENDKVVLFLDNFEEIGEERRKLVMKIVQSINNSTNNQIWITARPQISEELEEVVNQTSFKINQFDLKDVNKFIDTNHAKIENASRLIIHECINETNKSRSVTNPLILNWIINDIIKRKELNDTNCNLYTIFENFINWNNLMNETLHIHSYYALKDLKNQLNGFFTDIFTLKKIQILNLNASPKNDETIVLGIVYVEFNHFRFIQDAFADFFLSKFFIKTILIIKNEEKTDFTIKNNKKNENSYLTELQRISDPENVLRLFFYVISNSPTIQGYIFNFLKTNMNNIECVDYKIEALMITKFRNSFRFIFMNDDLSFNQKLSLVKFVSNFFKRSQKVLNSLWGFDRNQTLFIWILGEFDNDKILQINDVGKEFFDNWDEIKGGKFQRGNLLYQALTMRKNDKFFVDFVEENLNVSLTQENINVQNFTVLFNSNNFLTNDEKAELLSRYFIEIIQNHNLSSTELKKYWSFIENYPSISEEILFSVDFKTYKTVLHFLTSSDKYEFFEFILSRNLNHSKKKVEELIFQKEKSNGEISIMSAFKNKNLKIVNLYWNYLKNSTFFKKILLFENFSNTSLLEIATSNENLRFEAACDENTN